MSNPEFTVTNLSPRSRISTFFRLILVIPHAIIDQVWQYLAQILTLFQWFIILFTGKRSKAMWKLQNAYLGYSTRVGAYLGLMFDKWPAIGPDPKGEPVTYSFEFESKASRVSNFFRIFWLIPALIIALFVVIAYTLATIVSWFVIVLTGRHPDGLFNFMLKSHRFMLHITACIFLMTDDYPKFGS
jgi:hypothetical protein